MKKGIVLLLLIFTIKYHLVKAQPLYNSCVSVRNVFYNKDTLWFANQGGYYSIVKKKDLTIYNQVSLHIEPDIRYAVNRPISLVYKTDTMNIMLIYKGEWNPLKFEVNKLHYIKGTFIIDLYEYFHNRFEDDIKNNIPIELPIIIENFPCDCLEYRIKED